MKSLNCFVFCQFAGFLQQQRRIGHLYDLWGSVIRPIICKVNKETEGQANNLSNVFLPPGNGYLYLFALTVLSCEQCSNITSIYTSLISVELLLFRITHINRTQYKREYQSCSLSKHNSFLCFGKMEGWVDHFSCAQCSVLSVFLQQLV